MGSAKQDTLERLCRLLEAWFEQQRDGASAPKLHRAHGYVDGYMQSMLDAGVAERAELLQLVARVREGVRGPAIRTQDRRVDEQPYRAPLPTT